MATSGNFGTSNSNIVYWFESILNSQNVTNNTSSVTVRLWVKRTNTGYTTYGTGTAYCTINGTQYTDGITTAETITSTPRKMLEKTVTISHNSDGTKSLPISGYITMDVVTSSSNSWSTTLTTIARASQPSLSASSVNYGSAVTIYTNRADSSFTHTLRYDWGSLTGTIATGVATSYAWTVPNSFMSEIPSDTSSWGGIYCDTYNGGTLIGTKSITLTTDVPSTIVPTFTSVTSADTTTAVTTLAIGSYVQSLSKLQFTISGAAGIYSSTITKYEYTFEGTTYTGSNTYTMATAIKGSGSMSVTAKITDSRGRTASKTATFTVLAYTAPVITSFTVQRANSNGTLNDMGTYAKVVHNGTWNSLNSKNTVTINTYAKARGTTPWGTAIKTVSAGATGSYTGNFTSTQTYLATSSFDFRVDFVDKFNTTLSIVVMATGLVTMSWAPDGIGIGKVWEGGALDINGSVNVTGGSITSTFSAIRIFNGTDLNTIVSEGFYYVPLSVDAASMPNSPTTQAFSMLVERHAGYKQTITEYMTNGQQQMWYRNLYQVTWGSWTEIVTLIDSGSNANGNYIRYSDGTQICYHRVSTTTQAISSLYENTATTTTLYQGVYKWTFPSAFITHPRVTCSEFKWGTSASWGSVSSVDPTYADLRGHDTHIRATGTATLIGGIAIGRWF